MEKDSLGKTKTYKFKNMGIEEWVAVLIESIKNNV